VGTIKLLVSRIAVLAAVAVTSIANAAVLITTTTVNQNDCSGAYGQGFENCKIPAQHDPNRSPIIIKFEFEDGELEKTEINSALFPSISGLEFTFSFAGDGNGTWTYNPGADDPVVTYFVAKGGNTGFNLFSNDGDPNSDSWWTPPNGSNGRLAGLSHLSFYDTGSHQVPEPGSLALLALALIGLGVVSIAKR
jgi:PEP-CTERM motif